MPSPAFQALAQLAAKALEEGRPVRIPEDVLELLKQDFRNLAPKIEDMRQRRIALSNSRKITLD